MLSKLLLLALISSGGSGFSPPIRSVFASSPLSPLSPLSPPLSAVSSENLALFSPEGQKLVSTLEKDAAQAHVFSNWPPKGTDDASKIELVDQLLSLSKAYPTGLPSYLSKAKTLLAESKAGSNPFRTYSPSIPLGKSVTHDSEDFAYYEDVGVGKLQNAAFVIVAGGLGERLGYSSIKLSLASNLCDEKCYLQVYCEYVLACQAKCAKEGCAVDGLPVVIMTSEDTDELTRKLLADNDNFGLRSSQINIVKQGKVPALRDGDAGIALKGDGGSRWEVVTKPAGHGVVHQLLLSSGIVDEWENRGAVEYVCFLQDTNPLVVNGLLVALGLSIEESFMMNSICVPRIPGEAAGAITKLTHDNDVEKDLVINVEYNVLDPLLRSGGGGGGETSLERMVTAPIPEIATTLCLNSNHTRRRCVGRIGELLTSS